MIWIVGLNVASEDYNIPFLVVDPLAISGTVGAICDVGWMFLLLFIFYNNSL